MTLASHAGGPRSTPGPPRYLFLFFLIIKNYLCVPIYFCFMVITSAIMGVQSCLTYQIKGDILVYLYYIISNVDSELKILFFGMKAKNY